MAKSKKSESKVSKEDASFLDVAFNRFKLAAEAEVEIRRRENEDLKFSVGDQWDDEVKRGRDQDKRPCLTINKLPQYIHQITNDQRQNRPSIKVSPADSLATDDTAKVFQGLIRHIEDKSHADIAYDTAFDGTARKGRGFFRIITDYCDPSSFNLEIFIKRIRNSSCVYMDPNFKEPDGSDMNWCFITEDMPMDDFKNEFPDSEIASLDDFVSLGDNRKDWVNKDTVRIAEYFYKEFVETTIYLLSSGDVVNDEDLTKSENGEPSLPAGVKILDSRKASIPKIKWAKINALEKMDETEWPDIYIPVIPVLGDEVEVDGDIHFEGIIRHAKDPQRMLNYMASAEAEAIALAPKAPFVGAEGQFEGHEEKWQAANVKNYPYLEYKPTSVQGVQVPPPQRNTFEPAVMAITQARQMANDDLKGTTGVYGSQMGQQSNEQSGLAIQRRIAQSQTSNFHLIDNLTRSIRHAGRILVNIIPQVYDTAQVVRTLGEDGKPEMVAINQIFEKDGKQQGHFLSKGKYDVAITTGPSFATKRQEAVASMIDLTRSYPQMTQFAGDLMVRGMDWPGADLIADRLMRSLPPGIADDPKNGQPQLPPQAQAQMTQMNQMIQGLTQQLHSAQDILDNKKYELSSRERVAQLDRDSNERIKMAQLQGDLEVNLARLQVQGSTDLLAAQVQTLNHQEKMLSGNQAAANQQYMIQAQQNQQAGQMPPQQPPQQNQNLNGAGLSGPVMPNNNQPTGGASPG